MRVVKWESDNGFTLTFNNSNKYLCRDLNDDLGAEAQVVKSPGQDGATTYEVTLGQPIINLMGSLHSRGNTYDKTRAGFDHLTDEVSRAMRPNIFGTLTDYRPGGARKIRCRPIARPKFGARIGGSCTIDVEFIADTPFWTQENDVVTTFGKEIGEFRFPLRLPTRMGLYSKSALVDNTTGIPIFPTIEIFTTSAWISFQNDTTGEYLKVDHVVSQGQKLVIDTAGTRVTLWEQDAEDNFVLREDVSNWVTLDSEYWAIVPGKNVIRVVNEVADSGVVAILRYSVPV